MLANMQDGHIPEYIVHETSTRKGSGSLLPEQALQTHPQSLDLDVGELPGAVNRRDQSGIESLKEKKHFISSCRALYKSHTHTHATGKKINRTVLPDQTAWPRGRCGHQ